jgi:FHS family L-fucose permease-like MFS transporter
MAILGGSVMPPLMGKVIDFETILNFSATRASFFLPLICFVVITIYGYRSFTVHTND